LGFLFNRLPKSGAALLDFTPLGQDLAGAQGFGFFL
jgi:hypothetical protein